MQTDQKLNNLPALVTVIKHLNRHLELDQMLRATLPVICDIMSSPSGWIVLRNEAGNFNLAAAYGLPPALTVGDMAAFRTGPCKCQQMLLGGQLEQAVNVLQCQRLEEAEGERYGLQYHASIPLRRDDQQLGLLNIAFPPERGPFSQQELALLTIIGEALSLAIHRARLFQEIRASEYQTRQYLAAVLEDTEDFVALADYDHKIIYLNSSARQIIAQGQVDGAWPVTGIFVEAGQRGNIECGLKMASELGRWRGEVTLLTGEGREIPVQMKITAHREPGEKAGFLSITATDITERKRYEEELARLATHDPLTGLLNRHGFQAEVEKYLSRTAGDGSSGALLYIDIDNFKDVNDSLGHHAGDELLRRFAATMRSAFQESTSIIGRVGGDEFGVLLPNVNLGTALYKAGNLLRRVRSEIIAGEKAVIKPTVSIGIAVYPKHGRTMTDLMLHADLSMYESKYAGGNRIAAYSDRLMIKKQIAYRVLWLQRVRDALDNDGFQMFWQPVVDLSNNEIFSYELLLRLRGPDGTAIEPGMFLAIADQSSLLNEIDLWVVRQALSLLETAGKLGRSLRLNINLSGRTFSNTEYLDLIRHELLRSSVDPSNLIFEITEQAAIENVASARQHILHLQEMGCQFALDDFGVGYACFDLVKRLPVDFVKIDGSFIRNLSENSADRQLLKIVVEAASIFEKRTIAEFVESEETMALVKSFGVDYGQGHHLGSPVPVPNFTGRLGSM